MRVVKGKKDTTSVMNNTGFGKLAILKNGIKVIVPESSITKEGLIKKSVNSIIGSIGSITIEKACELNKAGFIITVA